MPLPVLPNLRMASQPPQPKIKQPKGIELIEIPDTLPYGTDDVDTFPMNIEPFVEKFMAEDTSFVDTPISDDGKKPATKTKYVCVFFVVPSVSFRTFWG